MNTRGATLVRLGRRAAALTDSDAATALDRSSFRAWAPRQTALRGLQRYDEALVAGDEALLLKPGDEPLVGWPCHRQRRNHGH